jgi:hypothetical protein
MMFVAAEVDHIGKSVKGAPYSAEAITEFTQMLGDGNRLHHKTRALLFRDSEGRTRREQAIAPQDALAADTEGSKSIFINDPVAKVSYVVLPAEKTVRKLQTTVQIDVDDAEAGEDEAIFMMHSQSGAPGDQLIHTDQEIDVKHVLPLGEPQKESLGTQTIEGVAAEGTRVSHTIPAGKIGNDLPITMVTETWYSKELGTVVMSKTSDPRMGDTVYRLTNISRNEPSRALFEIPADYQVEEGKREIVIKKKVVK